jgi:hypothetical protein
MGGFQVKDDSNVVLLNLSSIYKDVGFRFIHISDTLVSYTFPVYVIFHNLNGSKGNLLSLSKATAKSHIT